MADDSQSQILSALKSATPAQIIALLFRFGLADDFLKALKEREIVFSDQSLSDPAAIVDKARSDFCKYHSLTSVEQISNWSSDRGMTPKDFDSEAIHFYRASEFKCKLLETSRESLFLRYKDNLDRVLYSLIRVHDLSLADELFYSIEAGEVSFGSAASQYSIGPEAKTQGIVGPVDLTVPHPEIASRLRLAEPGFVHRPFQVGDWVAIIRLEYRYDSVFDESTKLFLEDVSLRTYLKRQIVSDYDVIRQWLQEAQ